MRPLADITGNIYGTWRVLGRDPNSSLIIDAVCTTCHTERKFRYTNLIRVPSRCPVCKTKPAETNVFIKARDIFMVTLAGVPVVWAASSAVEAANRLTVAQMTEGLTNNTLRCWKGLSDGTFKEHGLDWKKLHHLPDDPLPVEPPVEAWTPAEALSAAPAVPPTYQPLEERHWRIKAADTVWLADPYSEDLADLPCPSYLSKLIEDLDHPNFLSLEWRFSPASDTEVFAYWSEPNKPQTKDTPNNLVEF